MSLPLFTLSNVSLSAGNTPLVTEANTTIYPGEALVITGKSGCGKSTLLMAMLGLHPLMAGEISFNGSPLDTATVKLLRQKTAPVFQQAPHDTHLAKEVLLAPFAFHHNKKATPTPTVVANTLNALSLDSGILTKPFSQLSGGERQRITLARALLLPQELYVLDEPTSALDKESRRKVIALFLHRGKSVISVSHTPQWIDACDRVISIENKILLER